MAKFSTYLFVISGFLLIFYFLGLSGGGLTSGLLNLLLNPESLQTNEKIVFITGLLTSIGIGVTAAITRSYNPETILLASLTPLLLSFGYELLNIFILLRSVSAVLAIVIFAPMLFVYVFTVIEWWRGVTT